MMRLLQFSGRAWKLENAKNQKQVATIPFRSLIKQKEASKVARKVIVS